MVACTDYTLQAPDDQNVAEPDIAVFPGAMEFGAVRAGEVGQLPLEIRNEGNVELLLADIVVDDVEAFTVTGLGMPMTVPPGEAVSTFVQYRSTDMAQDSALTVLSNDPDSPAVRVPLFGGTRGPSLRITPELHDFGDLALGCADVTGFTVRSVGTEAVELHALTVGEGTYTLSAGATPPVTLEPGQLVDVVVQFQPTEGAEELGELTADSSDPAGPRSALLVGVGDPKAVCQQLPVTVDVAYEIADVAFVIDATGSMDSVSDALRAELADIIGGLGATVEDLTVGLALFRDYGAPYGEEGDKPFQLMTQQTDDAVIMRQALGNIALAGGGTDLPEAGMEALYQAATGRGYDQDCDGGYDPEQDVLPFIARTGDAFSGAAGGSYTEYASGGGDIGGMGFRDGVLPIVIMATDASQKDPARGDELPGGCPTEASASTARGALDAISGRLIGVVVQQPADSWPHQQMSSIADLTVRWNGSGPIADTILPAVEELIEDVVFDEVWVEVTDDPYLQITDLDPSRWEDVSSGMSITFDVISLSPLSLEEHDDTYTVTLDIYGRSGGGLWTLATREIYVVRPY
jgi:hypothetical protein